MNQEIKRDYLIRKLLAEMPGYGELSVPEEEETQKRLLRSLMNRRPPVPADPHFLEVQDAYLWEENRRRGIVDSALLAPEACDKRLFLWQGDITRLKADAIVNAANSALLGCFVPCHSCIDNFIHSCAGVQLRIACDELMRAQGHEEPAGKAKLTSGYNLPCKYVLHTVGPVVDGALRNRDCELLESCYLSCLELAVKHSVKSLAFCCISTGVFHFPQEEAAEIAVETVTRFMKQDHSIERVIFDVFTEKDFVLYRRMLSS